jgi:hypothetical protein
MSGSFGTVGIDPRSSRLALWAVRYSFSLFLELGAVLSLVGSPDRARFML